MEVIGRRTLLGGMVAGSLVGPAWARQGDPALDRIVRDFANANAFSGVVMHARRGRPDYSAAFGMENREAATPVTLATRFRVGSVSKRLTSVAVLRLVERGKLSLDAPVTQYLPDFRADTGAQVTLRRMLSNTSGIHDKLQAAIKTDPSLRTSTASSAEMVRNYADGDITFAPGTQFDYNVINWVIVHAVLERVTGMPFGRILETLVFAPLKLRDAGLADSGHPDAPRLAAAYAADGKRKMDPVASFAGASGNIYLTAADSVRAAHGIFSTGFLSARSRAALTHVEFAAEDYGLGGRVRTIDGRPWTWDTGKVQGYRAHIMHDLTASRTIVILNSTDMSQTTLGDFAKQIAALG